MLLKNTNCQILDQYSADKKTPESIFSIEKKSLPQREMNATQWCARHDGTSGSRKLRLFLDFCRLSESLLKFFNKKNEICNIFTLWKCIYVGWRHILSCSIKADFSSWWWTWSGPQVSTLVNYVIRRMWSCFNVIRNSNISLKVIKWLTRKTNDWQENNNVIKTWYLRNRLKYSKRLGIWRFNYGKFIMLLRLENWLWDSA